MFIRKKSFLLASSVAMLVNPSWAEGVDVTEVMVWGTEISASSLKLDKDDIMIKQADHMSDLLRAIPGVDVGGAHSLNQRITIRSMDDKDVAISIDGANQNTYMYHHMGNLQIHADILKSVDIQVGNNSVVNGNLGGAVRFETKSAKDLLANDKTKGGRVQASLANNGSNRYSLTGYAQLGEQVDVLAYYNYVDRDDFEVGGGEILDETGAVLEGTDGSVRGLAGELNDALFKLGWNINDDHRLKFGYEAYTDEGDYSYRPDMGLATDIAIAGFFGIPLVYPTEFTRDTLTLNYDSQWGEHTSVKATVFSNTSSLWRDERGLFEWEPDYATIKEGQADNIGFNVLAHSSFEWGVEHSFTYGLDTVDYKTHYIVDSVELAGEKSSNGAVFVEDRIELNHGVSVTPGMRYDNVNVESAVANDTYQQVSYAFAVEYEANDNLLLRASTTELFRAPSLSEVFTGAGLDSLANYNINAETGLNSELAFAYQSESFLAGATVFQTLIETYSYQYAPNPPAGGRSWEDNVGDVTIDGFEAYFGFNVDSLDVLLSYSTSDSELDAKGRYQDQYLTERQQIDGGRLDRQQGGTFTLSADYGFSAIPLVLHLDVLSIEAVNAEKALDTASVDNSKDSSVTANVSLLWTPAGAVNGLTVAFGIDNLFDQFYASHSSRNGLSFHRLFEELYLTDYEPGRNIKTTVSYQF